MGQRRSFWTAENLMASVFHGDAAIRRGFGFSTLSGIALYLLIYSLLGAAFALAVRNRFTSLGTVLIAVLFSMGWYWLWFRAIGQAVMPLVWLLHAENATVFGHVIFGVSVARYTAYLPEPVPLASPATAPEPAAEPVSPDPDLSGATQVDDLPHL
jgi:phosphoglycerol transferase MdoB-like AlkP superfamily enzyme